MPDLSFYDKRRGLSDYMNANRNQALQEQLVQAQISKSMEMDVDKLGERAFMKAAQGLPLTQQELGAARVVDAKSGGIMFNPATGAVQAKPRISDKIGLDGLTSPQMPVQTMQQQNTPAPQRFVYPSREAAEAAPLSEGNFVDRAGNPVSPISMPTGDKNRQMVNASYQNPPSLPNVNPDTPDPYAQLRSEASHNPKLRQENLGKYSKALPNAVQLKQAINDYVSNRSSSSGWERLKTTFGIPTDLGSAYTNAALIAKGEELYNLGVLNGPDLDQLRSSLADPRTFSGAVATDDTVNSQASKMIDTIDNRMGGIAAGAGMKYVRDNKAPAAPVSAAPKRGAVIDGYMFMGGDPGQEKNYKKVK